MSPGVRKSRPLPAPPITLSSPVPPPPPPLDGPSRSYSASSTSTSQNGHAASSSVSTITQSSSGVNGVRRLPQIDLEAPAAPSRLASHSDSLPVPGYEGNVRVLDNRSPSPAPSMRTESYRAAMPDPYYPSSRADDVPSSPVRPRGAGAPSIPGHSGQLESPESMYSPGSIYSPGTAYGGITPAGPSYAGLVPPNRSSLAYDDAFDSNPSTPRARGMALEDDYHQGVGRTPSASTTHTGQSGRFTSSADTMSSPPTSLDRSHSIDSYDSYMKDDGDGYETYMPEEGSPYADARPYEDFLGNRQPSIVLSSPSEYSPYTPIAGPSTRRVSDFDRMNAIKLELHDDELDEPYEDEEEEEDDADRFVNLALLSHIAVKVRDQVPRGTHVKGGIPYHRAFTGRDIVVRRRALRYALAHPVIAEHHPAAGTARSHAQPRLADDAGPPDCAAGRSQPPEPAVLLRGRMGRPRLDGQRGRRLYVPGRRG